MLIPEYRAQADLLLSVLPHVAGEDLLALKGGTAINLFIQDMPRLSVDIDLAYTDRHDDRSTALQKISDALDRIEGRIKKAIPGTSVTRVPMGQGQDVKLNCQSRHANVKIEVNTITRGTLYPPEITTIRERVQNEFQKFAAIRVVSLAELYGGKICAALDRQHPRDLFDIFHFFKSGLNSDDIKRGFLLFLLSHSRPAHELLKPRYSDQRHTFEKQFRGMTVEDFNYGDYEATRVRLVTEVNSALTDRDKDFLMGFAEGNPDWEAEAYRVFAEFPAVQWKLENIRVLKRDNVQKHTAMMEDLASSLGL